MRWKSPSERVQMVLLSPIIVPAAVVLVGALIIGAPIWWPLQKWGKYRRAKGWHRWFAWYPVFISGFLDGLPSRWAWLETVNRRVMFDGAIYRWPEVEV